MMLNNSRRILDTNNIKKYDLKQMEVKKIKTNKLKPTSTTKNTSTEISKILLPEMSEHDKHTFYLNSNYLITPKISSSQYNTLVTT